MLTDSLGRGGSTTEWKAVMQELNLHKEEVDRLREEIEESRTVFKHEVEALVDQVLKAFEFVDQQATITRVRILQKSLNRMIL